MIVALGFSSLSAALMQTLVIPIQPELPALLHTSASNAAWIVTATLLGSAIAMPVAGRLADLRGQKPVLIALALSLMVGSLLCASSSGFALVLIGRVLQGVAMGYVPVAISMASQIAPPSMRNGAVAGISATLGVGGALGLPLAAWIAQDFDWHGLFWFATLLAVIVTAVSILMIPRLAPVYTARFDYVGAVGLALGVVGILVGVSKGNDWGWAAAGTLAAIIGGVVILTAWGFYETRHDEPLVDLRATARRPVLLTNLAALLIGFGQMTQSIVMPRLLQLPAETGFGLGQSVLLTGLWMAPAGIMTMLFSPIAARMLTKAGGRITLATGGLVVAAGYVAAFFLMNAPWQLTIGSMIAAGGVGIAFAALPTLIIQNTPTGKASAGVGFNSMMRSMGTTLAGAVIAIILANETVASSGKQIPAHHAFQLCFIIAASAAILATLVTLCIRRADTPRLVEEKTVESDRVAVDA
ncbi:MFS transporter [Cellulomonas sp. Y8]|uniref:MFS transporter n=1 Tax=Cellulomonas sp. Y8 TaxID=2591145 RepID=UPI003D75BCD1